MAGWGTSNARVLDNEHDDGFDRAKACHAAMLAGDGACRCVGPGGERRVSIRRCTGRGGPGTPGVESAHPGIAVGTNVPPRRITRTTIHDVISTTVMRPRCAVWLRADPAHSARSLMLETNAPLRTGAAWPEAHRRHDERRSCSRRWPRVLQVETTRAHDQSA